MTVRTSLDSDYVINSEYIIPPGVPIHVHMYTLHNQSKSWYRGSDFLPNRWLTTTTNTTANTTTNTTLGHPTCPFTSSSTPSTTHHQEYEGVGFHAKEVCYFPFSTGSRACTGRLLVLQLLEQFVSTLITSYRLDGIQVAMQEEIGMSSNATIFPMNPSSLVVSVHKIVSLGNLVAQHEQEMQSDGWVQEQQGEQEQEKEKVNKGQEE